MGKSFNKVIILGRLGKDPEVRSIQSGTEVAKFSVATESGWKDQSGEWQKKTEWHSCVAWAKLAEVVKKYVHKGDQIHIEGRLQTRSWDDKTDGKKRYATEIVVETLCLLGGERSKAESPQSTHEASEQDITDDDIPF